MGGWFACGVEYFPAVLESHGLKTSCAAARKASNIVEIGHFVSHGFPWQLLVPYLDFFR
jgi:hypothetical protein